MEGFTHSEVYSMPVYLRKFYWNELLELKKAEKAEYEKQRKKSQPSKQSSRFKR